MKAAFTLIALACAASAASATYCPAGTAHAGQPEPYWPDRCNEGAPPANTNTTTNTNKAAGLGVGIAGAKSAADAKANASAVAAATGGKAVAAGGSARQQQRQAQQQTQQTQQSTTVTGAGEGAGAYAGAGAGFNGDINISTGSSGGGTVNRSTYLVPPPLPPAPPVAALPATNIAMLPGTVCGPRKMLIQREVTGREYGWKGDAEGFVIGNVNVAVEETDADGLPLASYLTLADGTEIGHIKHTVWTKLGVSISNALAAGIWGKGGGAQASGQVGGQIEMLVKDTELEDCYRRLPVRVVYQDRVVTQEVVRVKRVPVYVNRPAAPPPCAPCCAPTVTFCPAAPK
jgi:hypothetical protein